MTTKFIQAWCEEHGFSNYVGAVIVYECLPEEDLKVDNFSEDGYEITTPNDTYTVYDSSDISSFIKEEENGVKDELEYDLRRNLPQWDIKSYIDWDEYFGDNPIEPQDVIDEDYSEIDFDYNHYFIIKHI